MREEVINFLQDIVADEDLEDKVTDEEIEIAADQVTELLWDICEKWRNR